MFHEGQAPLHFTLPKAGFEGHLAQLQEMAKHHGLLCTASVQHPATDTFALNEQGEPFSTEDGVPLFRPGGHGALLHNRRTSRQPIQGPRSPSKTSTTCVRTTRCPRCCHGDVPSWAWPMRCWRRGMPLCRPWMPAGWSQPWIENLARSHRRTDASGCGRIARRLGSSTDGGGHGSERGRARRRALLARGRRRRVARPDRGVFRDECSRFSGARDHGIGHPLQSGGPCLRPDRSRQGAV